jgi:hypothetical protein
MAEKDTTAHGSAEKVNWRRPKLEELGNIRQFVQSGQANGKSHLNEDGSSMAGNEAMP